MRNIGLKKNSRMVVNETVGQKQFKVRHGCKQQKKKRTNKKLKRVYLNDMSKDT